jgi:hypothetical protein
MAVAVTDYLARLKDRPAVQQPGEPEEYAALLARVDTAGHKARIGRVQYFQFLAQDRACVRLPLHFFTLNGGGDVVRLFWLDDGGRTAWGLRLATEELEGFAEFFRVRELLRRLGRPVEVRGYGSFRLQDFLPGETCWTASSQPLVVSHRQPGSGWVEVWLRAQTIRAERALYPPDLRVFATSPEQAERVTQRVAARKRKRRRA